MGAAIGVSIDEGISKDIRRNIEASGFDLVAHLCEQYQRQKVYCVSDADEAKQSLVIQSVDLTSKGADDRMHVNIEGVYTIKAAVTPQLFSKSFISKVELDEVRSGLDTTSSCCEFTYRHGFKDGSTNVR